MQKSAKNKKNRHLDDRIDNLISAWDDDEDNKLAKMQRRNFNRAHHEAYFMNSKEIMKPLD